jgi:hypothetical protein
MYTLLLLLLLLLLCMINSDQQVRELHLSYTTRRETERLLPNKTIEERMIAFQRECEDRFRKDYESQLNQVRSMEMSRIRSEEANKKRVEIDLARKELEGSYQHRLQAHMDREAESMRIAADKARQASMLEYESRQRMQRELDDLRTREENSRRKIELETQGIRMLESRLKETQVDTGIYPSCRLDSFFYVSILFMLEMKCNMSCIFCILCCCKILLM